MDNLEVFKIALEVEWFLSWVSSEAVEQVALDPVVEVVGGDDGSAWACLPVEVESCFPAFRLGSDSFDPDIALSLDREFFAEQLELLVHYEVLGAEVVVEVDGGEIITFPPQPEHGGHAVGAHAHG